ncbi:MULTISPECIES: MarR family winged helix-turn-helix transcriptional regulator [unclassified Nocardia]|uniref:MarR family winged helix-turn-helix transcriptional regulator n=1 Tax=unclassified Nocardia TaxID=2637762 RepID=UPI001CE49C28|nr:MULTISPECIES: MarR family transcriptional regulator [unclassified Nocardia]
MDATKDCHDDPAASTGGEHSLSNALPPGLSKEQLALLQQGESIYRRYLTAQGVVGVTMPRTLGLGATDFAALNLISLAGSMTAGELAIEIGLSTGATTRLIDRLEQAGCVKRVRDGVDRRKVVIEPSDEHGMDFAAALAPLQQKMGRVFADYDPAQLAVLFDYFAKATAVLREATKDLQSNDISQQ